MLLNLALTANLPGTANAAVFDRIRATASRPRIAWIPACTRLGLKYFSRARERWESSGFSDLEFCDIDEAPDRHQLAALDRYDVIYFSGGDPLAFRRNIRHNGLAPRLKDFLRQGGLIVGASGGAMQFTRNVSLFRLTTVALDKVIGEHGIYAGLGFVGYELLPHINRFEPQFIETVRRYSQRVPHDIIGVADGAAVLHQGGGKYVIDGASITIRNGVIVPARAA